MAAGRRMFALLVLLLANSAAGRGLSADGAGSAPVAAAKGGSVPAHQTIVNPVIAGRPCVYTPAVLPVYVDIETFSSYKPLTSCDDPRLSATEKAACLACASIRDRHKCLAQTAATYHGVDKESCTWVGATLKTSQGAGEKQVRLSLGVNSPASRQLRLALDVCSVDFAFQLQNEGGRKVYPMATMESYLYDVVKGVELPWGLQTGGMCLVKEGRWECSTSVVRHKAASAICFTPSIWTSSLAIVKALQRSNATCADTPAGMCTAYGAPYNYELLITIKEHRCRRGSQPGSMGPTKAAVPFGQQGIVLAPGGQTTDNVRDFWFSLDGASRASWKISSQYPIVVAAINTTVYDNLCVESTDAAGRKVSTCDWTQLKAVARPGTYCLGTSCAASLKLDPSATEQKLVMAYPKYSFFVDAPWIMNEAETPAQTVRVKELNAVKEGRPTMERPASPSGDRPVGGRSGGGGSDPPSLPATSSDGDRSGGSGDSWGASQLAHTAKHPDVVLTCVISVPIAAFLVLRAEIKQIKRDIKALRKEIRNEPKKTRKFISQLLQFRGSVAQSDPRSDSGASAAAS